LRQHTSFWQQRICKIIETGQLFNGRCPSMQDNVSENFVWGRLPRGRSSLGRRDTVSNRPSIGWRGTARGRARATRGGSLSQGLLGRRGAARGKTRATRGTAVATGRSRGREPLARRA
jgi:hypothetical protein